MVVTADQCLSSLINLGLSLFAATALSADEFGAFALVFAAYLLWLGVVRACVSSPLTIRFSTTDLMNWRQAASASAGAAILLGLGGSVLLGLVSAVAGVGGHGMAVLALVLPGLMLLDQLRFAFFARGRPIGALTADVLWAAFLAATLFVLTRADAMHLVGLVVAWGCAASLSALVVLSAARITPRVAKAARWLTDHRDLGFSLTGDFLLAGGLSQLLSFAVAAIAGVAAAGALRGAHVLLGPVHIVMIAAPAFSVPEGSRLLRVAPHYLRPAMYAVTAGAAAATLAWGLLLVALIPDGAGRQILGATWDGAHNVLPALIVLTTITALGLGFLVGLRVLEQPARSVRARAVAAPFLLLGGTVGAALAGAEGSVWGQCLPLAILVLAWRKQFEDSFRSYKSQSSSASRGADDRRNLRVPDAETRDTLQPPANAT